MAGIIRAMAIGFVLCIPLPRLWRSTQRLTWTTAVVLGTYLTAISLIFLAEVPSRILYWVDSRSGDWIEQVPALEFVLLQKGAGQSLLADAAANTVGGIFFVALLAAAYIWGEKQRKAGRFTRR